MFGRFAVLVGWPSTTNSDRLLRDGNMGDGPGNFSVGDVTYFDGSSMSQPSDAVQGLLGLLSVTLSPHGNPDSVFPFTACDIGVVKDVFRLEPSIRDCFRYNKTYFKENGEGFCEKSLLSANASVFEFFCLVRRVQVTRKDILMTHNVMSVNAELRACKYQPATSTIMEEEAMEQKLCMYCLYVREVQSLSIVQHCIAECGPHYAHVSCWKRHFCNNDLRIYETYAWMRNTGQGIIPSVRQAMCCPLEASLVMVNVIDNDGVIQQRFKPPCGSLKPST
jgi:hypothetical protein